MGFSDDDVEDEASGVDPFDAARATVTAAAMTAAAMTAAASAGSSGRRSATRRSAGATAQAAAKSKSHVEVEYTGKTFTRRRRSEK